MARMAQVDGQGHVVNVILADEGFALDGFTLIASDSAEIGDNYSGGVFTTPAAVIPVPDSISNFQGRAMLIMNSLFDATQAAINAIPNPGQKAIAQEAFERADFHRQSPLLLNVASQLGKTSDQIDAMFIQAADIKV